MMAHPNPHRPIRALSPQPLSIVILIIVLCFQAGYDPRQIQQALMAVVVALVALSVVGALSAQTN